MVFFCEESSARSVLQVREGASATVYRTPSVRYVCTSKRTMNSAFAGSAVLPCWATTPGLIRLRDTNPDTTSRIRTPAHLQPWGCRLHSGSGPVLLTSLPPLGDSFLRGEQRPERTAGERRSFRHRLSDAECTVCLHKQTYYE